MAGDEKQGRSWGFWVEMTFVGLGIAAVLTWLGAIVYLLIFG